MNYFILRGAPVAPLPPAEGDSDDVSDIKNWVMGRNDPQDYARYHNTL